MLDIALAIPASTYVAFLAATFVLNMTPGVDMMFTIASGMRGGARAGLAAAGGISLGVFCHVLLAALGLAALMAAHPGLLGVLRYVGAGYLLYLAWHAWRDPGVPATRAGRSDLSQAFVRGFVTNILNPKVGLFVLAFLPQFTDPALGPLVPQILILGTAMVLLGLLNSCLIGLAAGALSDRIRRHGRAMHKLSAILFAGLAARIVID